MLRVNAFGFRTVFLHEEWTEPYFKYGERSTGMKNAVMDQNSLQDSQLSWMAGKEGA
ncbi:MAG TPA: hypothetical protein VM124_01870 [Candidatus Limnocylindrales bacterium]|nr:hypothetical protein [Candidatus Limnocylindrales bacterium]